MTSEQLSLDHGAFGISLAEARSMDPQQSLVLSVGYGALIKGSNSTVSRSAFTDSNIGVFVGVEPSGLERKEARVLGQRRRIISNCGPSLVQPRPRRAVLLDRRGVRVLAGGTPRVCPTLRTAGCERA